MKKLTQKELESGFKREFKEFQLEFMKFKKKPMMGATMGGFISGFIYGLKVAGYKREDLDYVLDIDHSAHITIKEAKKCLKK